MGLTDFDKQGVYKWYSSNDTPTYFDWVSGEPDHSYEHCAFYGKNNYQWGDIRCTDLILPICEEP